MFNLNVFLQVVYVSVLSTNSLALRQNLALNKNAYQSSTYQHYRPLSADLAVDGNNDTNVWNQHCAHGRDDGGGPNWLVVDLGRMYRIEQVDVTPSRNYPSRLDYFIVGLTNNFNNETNGPVRNKYDMCGQHDKEVTRSSKISIQCITNLSPYRYVIIQQPESGVGRLVICEVEVYETAVTDNLHPFIGCFEKFEDEIENVTVKDDYCGAWCHGNWKTFFYLNDEKCACGNAPVNSQPCKEGVPHIRAVCPRGFYGNYCEERCHCKESLPCDVRSGECSNGCSKNWTGSSCQMPTFENNKIFIGCMSNEPSVKRQDRDVIQLDDCVVKCRNLKEDFAAWRDNRCWCLSFLAILKEYCGEVNFIDVYAFCPRGFYGFGCFLECHCRNNTPCSYATGRCFDGCQDGWTGPSCNERECSVNNGNCKLNSECVQIQETNTCQCNESFSRKYIGFDCELIDINKTQKTIHTNSSIAIVTGILFAVFFLLLGVVIFLLFRNRINNLWQGGRKMKERTTVHYSRQISTDPVTIDSSSTYSVVPGMKLKLADFPDYVATYSQSFVEEFKSLQEQSTASCAYALLKQVRQKNRFRNILPYDNNRVILKQLPGSDFSDYINASYITGCRCPIIIATQGPTSNSIHDFWRMVGEQDVGIIVMLCNSREGNKSKCDLYWPENGAVNYGGYKIEFESLTSWPGHFQRTFKLETPKFVQRQIVQLHYTRWPDHGVPDDITQFLSFRKIFRMFLNEKQCVSLVHCSAGVGRTGCFLAVDYLLEKATMDEYIDVPECVRNLREERPKMVQTQIQYEFIYNSLVVKEIMGDTTFRPHEFIDFYKKTLNDQKIQNCLMNQFELVLEKGQSQSHIRTLLRNKQQRCKEIKNEMGQLSISFHSYDEDYDISLMLFSSYDLLIVFDPNKKLLSTMQSYKLKNGDCRSFHNLKEHPKADYGQHYTVDKPEANRPEDIHLYQNLNDMRRDYENVPNFKKQLEIIFFEECYEDRSIEFSRLSSLYKNVIQKYAKKDKRISILNMSESDICAVALTFSYVLDTFSMRNVISIFEQVIEVNDQSKFLLLKTLKSYTDLYHHVLSYLIQEQNKCTNLI